MSDTYGRLFMLPFATFDPDSCSLRTSTGTDLSDSDGSSPTLPRSGSMRNGECFELPTLVPVMPELGCGLLPSPAASEPGGGLDAYRARFKDGRVSTFAPLSMLAPLLPTPSCSDATGPQTSAKKQGGGSLRGTLLPTPTGRDGKGRNQRDDTTCLPGAVSSLPQPPRSDMEAS